MNAKVSANDVFSVTVRATSKNVLSIFNLRSLLCWSLAVLMLFIHVDLDNFIPCSGYNSAVVASIPDIGYFAFLRVVRVEL